MTKRSTKIVSNIMAAGMLVGVAGEAMARAGGNSGDGSCGCGGSSSSASGGEPSPTADTCSLQIKHRYVTDGHSVHTGEFEFKGGHSVPVTLVFDSVAPRKGGNRYTSHIGFTTAARLEKYCEALIPRHEIRAGADVMRIEYDENAFQRFAPRNP